MPFDLKSPILHWPQPTFLSPNYSTNVAWSKTARKRIESVNYFPRVTTRPHRPQTPPDNPAARHVVGGGWGDRLLGMFHLNVTPNLRRAGAGGGRPNLWSLLFVRALFISLANFSGHVTGELLTASFFFSSVDRLRFHDTIGRWWFRTENRFVCWPTISSGAGLSNLFWTTGQISETAFDAESILNQENVFENSC